MAGVGSAPGERRGGRQKGTLNKSKAATYAAIEKAKVTPLQYMLDVLAGKRLPAKLDAVAKASIQFDAAKAAAPYVHPRLNAIAVQELPPLPGALASSLSPLEVVRRIAFLMRQADRAPRVPVTIEQKAKVPA